MNIQAFSIDDPRFGIIVYRTNIDKSILNKLTNTLDNSTNSTFSWQPALVGYSERMPEYRDCYDCKIGVLNLDNIPNELLELRDVYTESAMLITQCVNNYCEMHNIKMEFMEAINFVKYGPGEHFAAHDDHGFSYVCTVSSIMYLNDDYEGGELEFTKLGIKFKPSIGDIIVFPSTYVYTHASLPVKSGTKYSAVTMFDYNDKWHKFHAPVNPGELKTLKNIVLHGS